MIHRLKTQKKYADAICGGAKTFEVRKEDNRHFDIGDVVTFHVIDSDDYHEIERRAYFVPYVLRHDDFPDGIAEGYCVFSIAQLSDDLAYYYTKDMLEGGK